MRNPDGTWATNTKACLDAWTALGDGVSELMPNWTLRSFDPDLVFGMKGMVRGSSVYLPVELCVEIVRLVKRNKELENARDPL